MNERSVVSRRRLLAGLAMGATSVAGCLGNGDSASSDGSDSDGTDGSGGDATATPEPTPTTSNERLPPPVKGDPDATVTLAVYEDYACPHCADYNANGLSKIESAYLESGEIRYEHRDAPIPVADPGSWQAASAAREVQARHGNDGFWAYAAKLFENSDELHGDVRSLFERLATELGFDDAEAIATAGVNRAHDPTVRADRQMAVEVGVDATPAFVLNGDVVTSGFGSDTISTVKSAVDEALSESA